LQASAASRRAARMAASFRGDARRLAQVAGSASFSPSLLAAAPHRLLFFAGAANVLLAMAWWTLWLVDAHVHPLGLPQPSVHAGWLHAIVMQYLVLPPFFFGFLLTIFPRWMNQPPLSPWHYVPVGAGLIGGQVLTLAGLVGAPALLHAGALVTMGGWLVGLALLSRIIWRDRGRTWHALSCAVALGAGFVGLAAYAAYLHVQDARLMFFAIKLGSFGLLLPVFVTVAHRMFPFFARGAIIGHAGWSPLPWLGGFWVLVAMHLGLELQHAYAWLWLPDGALAALTAIWLWRNRPRTAMPPLVRVLFCAYVWLPTAFALFATQAAWYAATGSFALGRAPAHALFIGFFGSLLVAMVTRVTQEPFRPAARPRARRVRLRRDPACRAAEDRGGDASGTFRAASIGRCGLAAGVRALGTAVRARLSLGARRRQAGVRPCFRSTRRSR
jgi:uncharacterized protein involved in response to NO